MAGVRLLKGNYDDVVEYLEESGYEVYGSTSSYLIVSDGTNFYHIYNDSHSVFSGMNEQWYIERIDKISDPDALGQVLEYMLPSDYNFKRISVYEIFDEIKYYFNSSWEVYLNYLENGEQVSVELTMDISRYGEYIFLTDGRYQYFVDEITKICTDWVDYINDDNVEDFATKIIEHEGSVPVERLPELVEYYITHFSDMKLELFRDDIVDEIVNEIKVVSVEYGYDVDVDYDNRIIDLYYF